MSTMTDTFEQLTGQLPNPPCDISEVTDGKACKRASTHVVIWRETCAGGGVLQGEQTTPLCKGHLRDLLLSVRAGNIVCVGCHDSFKALDHAIVRVESL